MVKLQIAEQSFFNNGEFLLPTLKDKSGQPLQQAIGSWLNQSYDLSLKQRMAGIGFDATELNNALRNRMYTAISGIHGETHVENGALSHRTKEGFDFSLYDEHANILRLRDEFIGDKGQFNGEAKLLECYKQVGLKKRDWRTTISSLGGTPGISLGSHKEHMTIVGELQFGNWALVKHDLLRLLNSSNLVDIDYYIYIAATGSLLSKLSDGIVSYSSATNAIQENIKLLKTPMWVIGLDCGMLQ